jgi:hypothetical protein
MNRSDLICLAEARRIALREAGLERAAFSAQAVCEEPRQRLYQLDYTSDYMEYCCFVNAGTGEVVGFDSRPRVA